MATHKIQNVQLKSLFDNVLYSTYVRSSLEVRRWYWVQNRVAANTIENGTTY